MLKPSIGLFLLATGILCAVAPSVVAYLIFVANVAVHPAWYLLVQFLAIAALLGAGAAILLYPLLFLFRSARNLANKLLIVAVAIVAANSISLFFCQRIENSALESLITRSEPLVKAILQFESSNHKPPKALQQLVPQYIGRVPATGIKYWPSYEYKIFTDKEFVKHRWELRIKCNTTDLSPSYLFYWPTQKYPDWLNERLVTKMRSWGHVHFD
jgi:hypothetical protein